MKQLKDYLHIYLGCEVSVNAPYDNESSIRRLIGIDYTFEYPYRCTIGDSLTAHKAEDIKPILRPLSDMTDEEKNDIGIISTEHLNVMSADEFRLMLSKHFDLFGLIESGLAIDKTKTSHIDMQEDKKPA